MGLGETIGRFMMKFFKPSQGWEDNVTLEQIEEMERQGCDVADVRKRFEDKIAAKEAVKRQNAESMSLEKLNEYKATPRSLESEFMKDVFEIAKPSSKRKEKMANAPIVYGAVVQAHYLLFEPGNNERMGVVFVFAMDEKHMYDQEWLRETAEKISAMKESGLVPEDNQKFIKTLRDDQSMFCFKLGASLSGDADAWCATYAWPKQSYLPMSFIPESKVLPFILVDYPEFNSFAEIEIIPSKYYTK